MVITPQHWGKPKWFSIHVTCHYIDTLFYNNLDRQNTLIRWIQDSAEMLACSVCEAHFKQYIQQNPLPIASIFNPKTAPFLRWSIRAHNSVRARQGKPLANEEEVVQTYQNGEMYGLNDRESSDQGWQIAFGILLTLVLLSGVGLYLWWMFVQKNSPGVRKKISSNK